MAYPAKINALVDIAGTSTLAAVGHAARHNDLNDAFDELAVVLTVPAANTLALAPGGTERMRIDSSGNVGIGTTGAASKLEVNGAAAFAAGTALLPGITTTGDLNTGVLFPAADTVAVSTGGTERLRITSAGNVGIGTSTPAKLLDVNGDALVSGMTVGKGAGAVSTNTAVGGSALNANTSGGYNTAVGKDALLLNTTGGGCTALGITALRANTTGLDNTALGTQALLSNTTASNNTAVGQNAMNATTAGSNNTAVGRESMTSNTTGSQNTATGMNALRSNTTGINNTAVGYQSMNANTTGGSNAGFGQNALYSNMTGGSNTAVGLNALFNNTTANDNTAVGLSSLSANTTGASNTAVGVNALVANTTADNNTAIGMNSLYTNTTGHSNSAHGRYSLFASTTGIQNTAIGHLAGWGVGSNSNTTGNNNSFVGNESVGASATASNAITLGNGSIATLRCQVTTITALSDARDKANIEPIPAGLDFVNRLSPVAFDWDTRDGAKVGIADMGFIAQDLLQVMEDTGIEVPNLVSRENPDRLEAGYGTLIPVLVQAIKELTSQVKQLQEAAHV